MYLSQKETSPPYHPSVRYDAEQKQAETKSRHERKLANDFQHLNSQLLFPHKHLQQYDQEKREYRELVPEADCI
jgi:hypothetical protein